MTGGLFRLRDWLVEPRLNRLTRDGESLQIELKMMDVLVCLAEHAGELVERQQLIDTVWATEFISENILTRAIAELRRTLGDDAKEPRYIETIHRRGYRLIAPVEFVTPPTATVTHFPARPAISEDDRIPYPGLAAFRENDAEFFFGREAEVAQLWRKITTRRLLAVIGPSGVGKSSLLRAGLLTATPDGWSALICQPGEAPFPSLARTLAPHFEGDPEALAEIFGVTDEEAAFALVCRWRQQHMKTLLVVDQFEELFTQNSLDVQNRFAAFLGRVAHDADVHVLLSMRDDFIYRCHEHEALRPVFADLTAIAQPSRESLSRAVSEPAHRCGFSFDDDALVDEMVQDVAKERAALPLMAFTAARMWEERDREQRMLTRAAYEEIGGVHGALARHAEATIAAIGGARLSILKEIFRNLVTAQGTRATRELSELISVFDHPETAREVLAALIDARLLTSYEVTTEDGLTHRTIEIVHESLLDTWPRLVRWQTQDADAAQLRAELRQAARTWNEHGRTNDYLWSGRAFREYALWRESYPGGLSKIEEAFARAMTSLAKRRKRIRRLVATSGVAALLAVIAVIATSRQQAVNEALRAEAAKLLALGELALDTSPTASLAWAVSSLELTDTFEGRMLALRALAEGPPVTVLPLDITGGFGSFEIALSPQGTWLAIGDKKTALFPHDGGEPKVLGPPLDSHTRFRRLFLSEDILLTENAGVRRWWSIPDPLEPIRVEELPGFPYAVQGDHYLTYRFADEQVIVERWPLAGGAPERVGSTERWNSRDISSDGSTIAYSQGREVFLRSTADWDNTLRKIGEAASRIRDTALHPSGSQIATVDSERVVRLWSAEDGTSRTLPTSVTVGGLRFGPAGNQLAGGGVTSSVLAAQLWDLDAPSGALPLTMKRTDQEYLNDTAFHPAGSWLITANWRDLGFWPLSHRYPWVLDHRGRVSNLAFTPDGLWLLTLTCDTADGDDNKGALRAWPLTGQNNGEARVLLEKRFPQFYNADLKIHPSNKIAAVSTQDGVISLVPIDGGPVRELIAPTGTWRERHLLAFSPSGRMLAAAPLFVRPEKMVVRVWNIESGEAFEVGLVRGVAGHLEFLDEDHLLWTGYSNSQEPAGGEVIFDLEDGTANVIAETGMEFYRAVSSDGSFMFKLVMTGPESGYFWRMSSGEGTTSRIATHGDLPVTAAIHPSDRWIATGGYRDRLVRVGPASGEEPHLLFGHERTITKVAFSPDGKWIASGGYDLTVRLWPMPDLSKPPLYTLPHDELLAKLKTLTNLRAVRNEGSATGWKLTHDPFPGWETVPTW